MPPLTAPVSWPTAPWSSKPPASDPGLFDHRVGLRDHERSGAGQPDTSNSYSGATYVQQGLLTFNNGNALGSSTITFTGPATLQALFSGTLGNNFSSTPNIIGIFDNQGNALTLTGVIGGGGTITDIGSGTLTLNGSANYTGDFSINGGLVVLANANALGTTGTISFNGPGGTLRYSVCSKCGRLLRPHWRQQRLGLHRYQRPKHHLRLGAAASNTGGLTKLGLGELTLSGPQNYTGSTTVILARCKP